MLAKINSICLKIECVHELVHLGFCCIGFGRNRCETENCYFSCDPYTYLSVESICCYIVLKREQCKHFGFSNQNEKIDGMKNYFQLHSPQNLRIFESNQNKLFKSCHSFKQ